ncbi:IS5 family transposase [Carboxylicivirga marina]|uniref:IS5 family transposase n=1 Tax=Carboxylicivirga marina TaxID=2800988 RepID=A0ABS1HQU5_9BACT|nr:IS5 family transposase [Carboxylicivirga marina]MBK3520043.1 IS5 family transposase [Carboxylicivirga marina]
MKGKLPNQNQRNLFRPILKDIINPKHELAILSGRINWQDFEDSFSPLYSHTGQPGTPIRTMVGLLLLKRIYNLGDETVMEQWVQNPYFQYFCGEAEFQWMPPCDPSDMVHFRNRIGEQGAEKILEVSIDSRRDEIKTTNDVLVDTTAQEKNITYPTDSKLLIKVIKCCNKIAKQEGIEQRQTYQRTMKKLLLKQRFAHHPKRKKEAKAALRKLRTIAGRLVRELERKLDQETFVRYEQVLKNCLCVVEQKKSDSNKIYSLHEPDTACIAKGKAHKKFEFGSKVSFAVVPKVNIIVGIKNFNGNPNDTATLEPALENIEKVSKITFKNAIVDRGYKGKKKVRDTIIVTPKPPSSRQPYSKNTMRKKCKSRAAVEPVIGHTKHGCRMIKNYLKGNAGNTINANLAAAGFNFKGLLRKIKEEVLWLKIILEIYFKTYSISPVFFSS